jgi:hypothetical protein
MATIADEMKLKAQEIADHAHAKIARLDDEISKIEQQKAKIDAERQKARGALERATCARSVGLTKPRLPPCAPFPVRTVTTSFAATPVILKPSSNMLQTERHLSSSQAMPNG